MKTFMSRAALAGLLMGASMLATAATPAPEGAEAFIVSPKDGATIKQDAVIKFGVKDISLAPAGDSTAHSGHHHLLIDTAPIAAGQVIPADAKHVHFGKAQTEVKVSDLKLTPGKHTLQLELGDMGHMAFEPPIVSKKITVNVE